MSNLRRYYQEGSTYFVTCVTYKRQPVLIKHIDLFWPTVEQIRTVLPFVLNAWVILPDHFHWLITPQDCSLSNIMRRVKIVFATRYRQVNGLREGRIWQNRFWDHVIRNETDLAKHFDYIRYNPVKHGLAETPEEYQCSSLYPFSSDCKSVPGLREEPMSQEDYGE